MKATGHLLLRILPNAAVYFLVYQDLSRRDDAVSMIVTQSEISNFGFRTGRRKTLQLSLAGTSSSHRGGSDGG